MKNKNVMLFGYWQNNLGDDLFLKIFTERYKNVKIYILTQKKYKDIYKSNNIKVITYDSIPRRILSKILRILKLPDFYYILATKKASTLICLGGSLFMESRGWKSQVVNLKYAVKKCTNSFIIGSNFGPYYRNDYLEIYKELFLKMRGICFRDMLSCNLFSELSNVRFSTDVVLNLKVNQVEQYKPKGKNYYVISVIDIERRELIYKYKDKYEKKIAEISTEIINNGYDVVLMSFCEREGDMNSISRIKSLLLDDIKNIKIYSHRDVNESLGIIANSKGIVATRFHAMILGFLYNKPVFPIAYSKKINNVISDYYFEREYVSINDIDKVSAKQVFENLQIKPNIPLEIIELAKEQFRDVDEFFD